MLADLSTPIGWRELLKRTVRETQRDDVPDLAAQLAYYFFLALFPALLCLIALASLFPLEHLIDDVTRLLEPVAPAEMVTIIRQQLLRISQSDSAGLFSLGLLGAIWSSSAAMVALMGAVNRAYGITDGRPWWKRRLTAVLLTVGLAFFVLISFTLVIAGPEIAGALARRLGLGAAFTTVWTLLQWPVAFAFVAAGIGIIYAVAPDADQERVWITPGSILATLLWILGSLGFRFYVVNFGSYEATYGAIGGVILLMLWFYLTGLVIIVGAEMNAEIDHASPWYAASVATAPGARRKIGRAAARAFRSAQSVRRPDLQVRQSVRRPDLQVRQSAGSGHPAHETNLRGRLRLGEFLAAGLAVALRWRSRARR
jgi:membrane protein